MLHLPRIGCAAAFAQILRDACRMRAILAMDDGCAGDEFFAFVKSFVINAVELRMVVHNVQPAVNRDDWHNATALGSECVDFLRERV